MGLYALAAFTTQKRTKEIGLRKVMGARVWDIVKLLLWQFSKPVLIANIIAWPLALFVMSRWLENFTYRIDVLWILPICIVAGVFSLVISWSTVAGNAAKVASASPIKALKYE